MKSEPALLLEENSPIEIRVVMVNSVGVVGRELTKSDGFRSLFEATALATTILPVGRTQEPMAVKCCCP
jgi:hypothetical protein